MQQPDSGRRAGKSAHGGPRQRARGLHAAPAGRRFADRNQVLLDERLRQGYGGRGRATPVNSRDLLSRHGCIAGMIRDRGGTAAARCRLLDAGSKERDMSTHRVLRLITGVALVMGTVAVTKPASAQTSADGGRTLTFDWV